MSLQAGDVIDGRYEVVRLLGQGGLGVVYLATQRSTEQPVAIKLIQPGISAHNNHLKLLRDRFIRETRLVGKLRHPHIVRLVDAGTLSDDQLFTVFEYIQGQELAAIISAEGPLNPREAVRLLVQTLEALSAAHDQGVVHRDFKPQNVMITSASAGRSAVVLDFGIAGVVEEARGNDYKTLTNSGHVPGTPWYMAPEQFDGNITPQTDLYAWGLVALECLTGAQVIQASTPFQAMIWQASREAVDLPAWLRDHRLGAIIARAVAKPLEQRYLTAAQLLRDLEGCPLDDLQRAPLSAGALTTASHPSASSASSARQTLEGATPPPPASLEPALEVSGEQPTEALAALPVQAPRSAVIASTDIAQEIPSTTPPPSRAARLPWVAAIILGVGLLAVAITMLMRPSSPATQPGTSLPAATTSADASPEPAPSADTSPEPAPSADASPEPAPSADTSDLPPIHEDPVGDDDEEDVDAYVSPTPQRKGRAYTPRHTHERIDCDTDLITTYDQSICRLCTDLTRIPLSSLAHPDECPMIEMRAHSILTALESTYSNDLQRPPAPSDRTAALHTYCATMIAPLELRILHGCPDSLDAVSLMTRLREVDTLGSLRLTNEQAATAPTSPPDLAQQIMQISISRRVHKRLPDLLLGSGERICAIAASRLGLSDSCDEDLAAFTSVLSGHEEELTQIFSAIAQLSDNDYGDLFATCTLYIHWRLAFSGCPMPASIIELLSDL